MKKVLILFLILSTVCSAQILNMNPVDIPIGPKNFNLQTVKSKHLRKITILTSNKPDGAIIHNSGMEHTYYFDRDGKILHSHQTVENKEKREESIRNSDRYDGRYNTTLLDYKLSNDTIHTTYLYDHLNSMYSKRIETDGVYDIYYYEYDKQRRLIEKKHFRENKEKDDMDSFKSSFRKLVSTETRNYQDLTKTQTKVLFSINENPPYKKVILNRNPSELLKSKYVHITSNADRKEYSYQYDSKNRILQKTVRIYKFTVKRIDYKYEYNSTGKVLFEKKYKNDILTIDKYYLYDKSTGLVKSEVNRDIENSSIQIVKYKYEFY